MVATINLGSFTTVNGQTASSTGIASGLDTQAIISSLVAAKQVPVTTLQNGVTLDTNKTAAYSTFSNLLSALQTAANGLRNVPGFDQQSQNDLASRQVFATTNTGVAATTYMGVTASPGATENTYALTVNSLAEAETQQASGFTSESASVVGAAGSDAAGMFSAGTFDINGTAITLAQGDSLAEVESKINTVSSTTNVSANIVELGSNNFQLVLQSNNTGTSNAFTISDPNNVISKTTTTSSGSGGSSGSGTSTTTGVSFTTTQAAANASLTFNGTTITRDTNTISDIVPDVTFTLYEPTPAATQTTAATSVSVQISNDTTTASTAIQSFVTAYNNLQTFAAQQTQRNSSGAYVSTAYLGSETAFQSVMQNIDNDITSGVAGLSSNSISTLADIGISFTDTAATSTTPAVSNVMSLDQTTLTNALTNNYDDVAQIFEFNFNASSDTVQPYNRTGAIPATSYTLNINTSQPTGSQVMVTTTDSNGNADTFAATYTPAASGGGGTITGVAGTPLANMSLLYSGSGQDTITVNQTQGLADLIYNDTTNALTPSTGTIAVATAAIATDSTNKTQQIATDNANIATYQSGLVTKYSALETQIEQANSILEELTAQQDAALANTAGS